MDRGQKKIATSSRVLGYQSSRGFQPQPNLRLQPQSNPGLQRQPSIGSQSQQSVELQAEPSASSQSQRGRYARSYVQWNREMDMALISSFYSSLDEGLKGENDWKPQAYEAAKEHINTTLKLNLTKENVRNRHKTMKKHYGYVNEIQTVESGLLWDNEKKMVLVTSDTLHIWENYLKVQPLAGPYKNKMIEFWDDIVVFTTRFNRRFMSKEKRKKDPLIEIVGEMATSLKEYVEMKKNQERPKPTGEEIYGVISKIVGLNRNDIFAAVNRLMNGCPEQFYLLKSLPDDEKIDYVLYLLQP
ncbi:hypothetical protein COLO4_34387 [Corchorus olitorius]|uniref:Myb/SANT-like domain-containing protein n=1 Tax=Corchorus olitorius TaxID=93759 RepID=A0A1R3GKZ9_9ROSI|nr:hypothetical protein COLO4_34387 [Corchorus olitorius]